MSEKKNDLTIAPKNFSATHLPCVILLDRSGSTSMNRRLSALGKVLQKDPVSFAHTDLCVLSIGSGGVRTEVPFCPAEAFVPPILEHEETPSTLFDEGITAAMNELERQTTLYRRLYMTYYRPLLFADSAITENMTAQARQMIRQKKLRLLTNHSSSDGADHWMEDVLCAMLGSVSGPILGSVSGPILGSVSGPILGSVSDPMLGSVSGPMVGSMSDPMVGSVSDPMVGSVSGPIVGVEEPPAFITLSL